MGWSGPMTERQFRQWELWEESQLNYVDKQTYYLMQIAAEVRRTNVKNPNHVDIDDFALKLKRVKKEKKKPAYKYDSKSIWLAAVGYYHYHPRPKQQPQDEVDTPHIVPISDGVYEDRNEPLGRNQ